jgi:hypothetical protein
MSAESNTLLFWGTGAPKALQEVRSSGDQEVFIKSSLDLLNS